MEPYASENSTESLWLCWQPKHVAGGQSKKDLCNAVFPLQDRGSMSGLHYGRCVDGKIVVLQNGPCSISGGYVPSGKLT